MKKLKYILRHNYLFKVLAILMVVVVFIYTKLYNRTSIYNDESEFIGLVYKINHNTKTTLYIKSKENLVINSYQDLSNIHLGDKIKVKGKLSYPNNNTIPNNFNYRMYLYNNGIFYVVNNSEISKIANNTNVIYFIKEKINERINKISIGSAYLKIFILGSQEELNNDIIKSYRSNGLSHLFSVSGMHISLFAGIILYVLKRISYNNYFNYSVVIIFLISYALLIGNSPSVIRSITMYILFAINKVCNLKINSINIMCITLIIILIINPFYIYNISFLYSYLITFSIILYRKKIKSLKGMFNKSLYISLISFLVSFPICIYNFYSVNVLSIILNLFFIPLVSFIIFPLSLITFVIPILSHILMFFIKILETISLSISTYNIGIVYFSKPSFLLIIIYYICIYLFLYDKKYVYLFLVIICHKSLIYLDNSFIITFFDVGQGDSIFIKYPYNKGTILIDTSGNINSNYSVINENIIPYLRSIGINKINHTIITHGDYDHIGEAINLVNNFKVEKVIFNCGLYNDLEKELIKVLEKKKIKHYSCIKELNIDKNKLYFLQTKKYDNENDNSSVIYTELDGYKFMFMGDASSTTENEIMNKYNLPDIDVLKVGHHGSRTSSSKFFIDEINPKYSVISVGKNNRYGHPNKEVLDNLENSKIYRTDKDGSVIFKIKNKKLQVETCNS